MLFRLLKDHSSARKSSLALIGQKALQKHEMQTVGPSVSRVPSHIQGKGCVKARGGGQGVLQNAERPKNCFVSRA